MFNRLSTLSSIRPQGHCGTPSTIKLTFVISKGTIGDSDTLERGQFACALVIEVGHNTATCCLTRCCYRDCACCIVSLATKCSAIISCNLVFILNEFRTSVTHNSPRINFRCLCHTSSTHDQHAGHSQRAKGVKQMALLQHCPVAIDQVSDCSLCLFHTNISSMLSSPRWGGLVGERSALI